MVKYYGLEQDKVNYFIMNGHPFNVDLEMESTSTLNIKKTPMYVSSKDWGYNYIQWLSFSGEELKVTVYSKNTESYTGNPVYKGDNRKTNFYDKPKTPHAVLKFWAQNFITVTVESKLQSVENGDYKITDFSQRNMTQDLVRSDFTLTEYNQEDTDITRSYYAPEQPGRNDASDTTGTALELEKIGEHKQTCTCTPGAVTGVCTAPYEEEVVSIQKLLRRVGYYPHYSSVNNMFQSMDGKYCYYTKKAVEDYQKANGLSVTGVFNKAVKDKLKKELCSDDADDDKKTTTSTSSTTTNTT